MDRHRRPATPEEKVEFYKRIARIALQQSGTTINVIPHKDVPPGEIIEAYSASELQKAYMNGARETGEMMVRDINQVFLPTLAAMHRVETLCMLIVGAAFSGGTFPVETAQELAGELGRRLAEMERAVVHAQAYFDSGNNVLSVDMSLFVDARPAIELYKAISNYADGKDRTGERLRAFIANRSEKFAQFIEWRMEYKPGPKGDPVRLWIGKTAQETRACLRAEGKNTQWLHVQHTMIYELKQEKQLNGLGYPEDDALTILEAEHSKAHRGERTAYLRCAASDYKRKNPPQNTALEKV